MAPFIGILILGALGLLLVALLGITRRAARSILCPVTDRTVTVHFRQAICGGRLLDVESCSAFLPGTAVTCSKGCLLAGPGRRTLTQYRSCPRPT
jgi:hypothetical protein